MPIHIDEIEIKALSQQAQTDANQNWSIQNLTKHIRALWHHVERLEKSGSQSGVQSDLTFRVGEASLVLKRDGTILLKGNNIRIEGRGNIEVKAAANLALKGSKILEN